MRTIVAIALLISAAQASESPKELYLRAVKGDRTAAREAEKVYADQLKAHPADAVAQAYMGSLQVLESGRTMALWKKGRLAKDGLAALDGAVSRAPENLEVRYLRAISTFHLPSMFGREDQCAADFAWLAERVEKAAASGAFDPRYAASAIEHHRKIAERRR